MRMEGGLKRVDKIARSKSHQCAGPRSGTVNANKVSRPRNVEHGPPHDIRMALDSRVDPVITALKG
jgi:hypothetical protein